MKRIVALLMLLLVLGCGGQGREKVKVCEVTLTCCAVDFANSCYVTTGPKSLADCLCPLGYYTKGCFTNCSVTADVH